MGDSLEDPFFHRRETRDVIYALASTQKLCIYAGAGITINRSGLSWRGMVDAILAPNVPDARLRRVFIDTFGYLQSASTASQLFADSVESGLGSDYSRDRMVDTLRYQIYSRGGWLDGRLAQSIALLAYSSLGKDPKRSICLATPNYDDYLLQILDRVRSEEPFNGTLIASKRPTILYPTSGDPLSAGKESVLADWVDDVNASIFTPGALNLVHLHGRIVANVAAGTEGVDIGRYPVVSEGDYTSTAPWTEKVLEQLLGHADALLVGTSLTDLPLINALRRTNTGQHARYALVCMQGSPQLKDREYRRLATKRFDQLGVKPIYHDYYIQSAQFLQEVCTCVLLDEPAEYSRHSAGIRYGSRLTRWWQNWDQRNRFDIEEHQMDCHELLRAGVQAIRRKLGAPSSEALKVEVWLRWKPGEKRVLKLWASSTGTWPDFQSMREGHIATDDEYLSVLAFRNGHPTRVDAKTSPDSKMITGRWRSFLSLPIWDEDPGGSIPVGVITLASSREGPEGSLSSDASQTRLSDCLDYLRVLGRGVTSPHVNALDEAFGAFTGKPS